MLQDAGLCACWAPGDHQQLLKSPSSRSRCLRVGHGRHMISSHLQCLLGDSIASRANTGCQMISTKQAEEPWLGQAGRRPLRSAIPSLTWSVSAAWQGLQTQAGLQPSYVRCSTTVPTEGMWLVCQKTTGKAAETNVVLVGKGILTPGP